jgi:glycosyltransferase involved in cell wall biosynthesis
VRVSVVVPFRNAERHLARCLGSLVAQEPVDGGHELVVVDDGSTDRSADIARRFPSVRVVQSRGTGPYAARNTGILATAGDVIALTDGDCEAAPDWLRQIDSAFRSTDAAVLVGPRFPAHDSFALALVSAYERAKDSYVFDGRRADLYYASANNMALLRATWDAVGPFEERRRGADTLYVRRVAERLTPQRVRYAPQLHVRHLEIDGLGPYYRKLLAYGASAYRLRSGPGRVLKPVEQLAVWRAAVTRERMSAPRAAALLVTLGGGELCWGAGTLAAVLSSRPGGGGVRPADAARS